MMILNFLKIIGKIVRNSRMIKLLFNNNKLYKLKNKQDNKIKLMNGFKSNNYS